MNLSFSFVIPVYNRPDEVKELMSSLMDQSFDRPFEIVIVEDGSDMSASEVVDSFKAHSEVREGRISISYYEKDNSGPGNSRNFGMQKARGNYFLILDSDCILPPQYLSEVEKSLNDGFVHCFGGPDAAHESFTMVQKAINYAMTAVLTTGGIRGNKKMAGSTDPRKSGYQPRSFNMGISKTAFEATGGFGNIHPGEDPDLTFRIWEKGFATKLIGDAFVYHKRRITWFKFFGQVKKFGMVRPILNRWHPHSAKVTYWFPTLFVLGLLVAALLYAIDIRLPLYLYAVYFSLVFIDALYQSRNLSIALLAIVALCLQFIGYGFGFLKSTMLVNFSKKEAEELFPELFFKTD